MGLDYDDHDSGLDLPRVYYLEACNEVSGKKDLPALFKKLRQEKYHEGKSVQILHVGSYDDEGPVLNRLHQIWIPENGYVFNGKHHEIYLNDPRKVAPEKLKTILRPTNPRKHKLVFR